MEENKEVKFFIRQYFAKVVSPSKIHKQKNHDRGLRGQIEGARSYLNEISRFNGGV